MRIRIAESDRRLGGSLKRCSNIVEVGTGVTRNALHWVGRALTGGRPFRSAWVVAAAVATAALHSSGFGEWWVLPVLVLALLVSGARRRG
jgi:hypothetical protein